MAMFPAEDVDVTTIPVTAWSQFAPEIGRMADERMWNRGSMAFSKGS